MVCGVSTPSYKDAGVCSLCKKEIEIIAPPYCSKCGLSGLSSYINPEGQPSTGPGGLCGLCLKGTFRFAIARSCAVYAGVFKRLIQGLKFERRKELTFFLADFLIDTLKVNWEGREIDLIVPVPLHTNRRRERGFNQSEILARLLAKKSRIALCNSILIRSRDTQPQVGLTDRQRVENVKNAFVVKEPGSIRGKHVLLIDDVFTTGSTANECCRVLLLAGATAVDVLTLARVTKP